MQARLCADAVSVLASSMARMDLGTSSAMVGIFLQKIHVELGTVSTKFPNFRGTTLQCRELFDLLDLRIVDFSCKDTDSIICFRSHISNVTFRMSFFCCLLSCFAHGTLATRETPTLHPKSTNRNNNDKRTTSQVTGSSRGIQESKRFQVFLHLFGPVCYHKNHLVGVSLDPHLWILFRRFESLLVFSILSTWRRIPVMPSCGSSY